jgi:hypothetical protein
MTQDRIILLEQQGFAWNAQVAAWERRLKELEAFKEEHGTLQRFVSFCFVF